MLMHNLVEQLHDGFNAPGHSLVFVPDEPVVACHLRLWEETHQTWVTRGHEVVTDPDARTRSDRLKLSDGRRNFDVRSPTSEELPNVVELGRVD